MLRRISILGAFLIVVGTTVVGAWLYSEHAYAQHVRPTGISDLRGFLARYSEVDRSFKIARGADQYFVVTLRVSSGMALPSGPPAYVFDARGRLVDWSMDTGEDPRYISAWPPDEMQQIDLSALKEIEDHCTERARATPVPDSDAPDRPRR